MPRTSTPSVPYDDDPYSARLSLIRASSSKNPRDSDDFAYDRSYIDSSNPAIAASSIAKLTRSESKNKPSFLENPTHSVTEKELEDWLKCISPKGLDGMLIRFGSFEIDPDTSPANNAIAFVKQYLGYINHLLHAYGEDLVYFLEGFSKIKHSSVMPAILETPESKHDEEDHSPSDEFASTYALTQLWRKAFYQLALITTQGTFQSILLNMYTLARTEPKENPYRYLPESMAGATYKLFLALDKGPESLFSTGLNGYLQSTGHTPLTQLKWPTWQKAYHRTYDIQIAESGNLLDFFITAGTVSDLANHLANKTSVLMLPASLRSLESYLLFGPRAVYVDPKRLETVFNTLQQYYRETQLDQNVLFLGQRDGTDRLSKAILLNFLHQRIQLHPSYQSIYLNQFKRLTPDVSTIANREMEVLIQIRQRKSCVVCTKWRTLYPASFWVSMLFLLDLLTQALVDLLYACGVMTKYERDHVPTYSLGVLFLAVNLLTVIYEVTHRWNTRRKLEHFDAQEQIKGNYAIGVDQIQRPAIAIYELSSNQELQLDGATRQGIIDADKGTSQGHFDLERG